MNLVIFELKYKKCHSVQTKISSSTQFIRREECTVERIGEYKQNERENCEAINDLTNYISIHQSYHRIQ
jgi:hypothetical protein